ncbi:MAG: thiamine pyrophosphate-dependent enzyme, partial [Myxococcota bacterium]
AGEAIGTGRPLLVLCGDLAFRHDHGGLAAACGLAAPLTVVVLDNGGGHIFDHLPIAAHPTAFEPYFITPQSSRIAALATACGARAHHVEQTEDLAGAIRRDVTRPGVGVVEAPIDATDNLARHHEGWRAVSRALRHLQEEAA